MDESPADDFYGDGGGGVVGGEVHAACVLACYGVQGSGVVMARSTLGIGLGACEVGRARR